MTPAASFLERLTQENQPLSPRGVFRADPRGGSVASARRRCPAGNGSALWRSRSARFRGHAQPVVERRAVGGVGLLQKLRDLVFEQCHLRGGVAVARGRGGGGDSGGWWTGEPRCLLALARILVPSSARVTSPTEEAEGNREAGGRASSAAPGGAPRFPAPDESYSPAARDFPGGRCRCVLAHPPTSLFPSSASVVIGIMIRAEQPHGHLLVGVLRAGNGPGCRGVSGSGCNGGEGVARQDAGAGQALRNAVDEKAAGEVGHMDHGWRMNSVVLRRIQRTLQ